MLYFMSICKCWIFIFIFVFMMFQILFNAWMKIDVFAWDLTRYAVWYGAVWYCEAMSYDLWKNFAFGIPSKYQATASLEFHHVKKPFAWFYDINMSLTHILCEYGKHLNLDVWILYLFIPSEGKRTRKKNRMFAAQKQKSSYRSKYAANHAADVNGTERNVK